VISLFTIPKPFVGHVGLIQRNALRSWARLAGGDVQVIVCGDEPGCRAAAIELGCDWLGGIERNEFGTPLLNDAFAKVSGAARHDVLAYANSDIVLFDDLIDAVRSIDRGRWLMVGQRTDLEVARGVDPSNAAEVRALRDRAGREGRLRGVQAMDYFVWTRRADLADLPPLAVGRPGWDNFFVERARYEKRIAVIDATARVLAVHQNHDYAHVPGGDGLSYEGPEADRQRAVVAERARGSILDASHVLTARGLKRANGDAYRWARCKRRWHSRWWFRAESGVGRLTHRPRRAVRNLLNGRHHEPAEPAPQEARPRRRAA